MEDNASSSKNDAAKSSRNTPSPISSFDETFTEFVGKMSENAQSSTPQKDTTSMNASNSDASTSSVIISGILQTTSTGPPISVVTKAIPVTTSHIPVQAIPVPTLSKGLRYSSWPELPKPKSNETKTRYSLPSSLKTAQDKKKPMPIVSAQSTKPTKKSSEAATLLTLEQVKEQIKAELDSYTCPTAPVKSEPVPSVTKAKKVTNLPGPSRLENNQVKAKLASHKPTAPVKTASISVLTKAPAVRNLPGPSTSTGIGKDQAKTKKSVSFKDQPKEVPIYILKQAKTENVKTQPDSSKNIQPKAPAQSKIRALCVPSTSKTGNDQTKATPVVATTIKKAKILKVYKAAQIPNLPPPSTSTASTTTAHLIEVKGKTARLIPVRALTPKRAPSSTGTKAGPSKMQIPLKTAIVPVQSTPVTVRPSPVSVVNKAAQLYTSLAEKAGQLECVAGPSNAPTSTKKRSYNHDEDEMVVEYLEEALPRPGRPKGSGNQSIPTDLAAIKKYITPVESPPVKNRPGRPRKPFDFDRIISGLRSIRLPNAFWSVHVKETPNWKQVCFSRAVLAKTDNPVKNDRVVRFTNSVKYSVKINNRKVKLLAAPATVATFKDIQILLRIVNDIKLHDPMLEFQVPES